MQECNKFLKHYETQKGRMKDRNKATKK